MSATREETRRNEAAPPLPYDNEQRKTLRTGALAGLRRGAAYLPLR